jgi:hypothetical protein
MRYLIVVAVALASPCLNEQMAQRARTPSDPQGHLSQAANSESPPMETASSRSAGLLRLLGNPKFFSAAYDLSVGECERKRAHCLPAVASFCLGSADLSLQSQRTLWLV